MRHARFGPRVLCRYNLSCRRLCSYCSRRLPWSHTLATRPSPTTPVSRSIVEVYFTVLGSPSSYVPNHMEEIAPALIARYTEPDAYARVSRCVVKGALCDHLLPIGALSIRT